MRLELVMTNLLTNVIKYAPGAAVKISGDSAGGQARLTIADGGAGISREQQKRIFDPFERGLSSRQVGGLGLGLFIVRQILHAHRGTITVDSQPVLAGRRRLRRRPASTAYRLTVGPQESPKPAT
jgi:signal transduction histidine kinase